MRPTRRSILRGLGALSALPLLPRVARATPAPTSHARVPGFHDMGPWTGDGPAPVFVTLSLNINDFLRPEREAQSVHRWLDDTAARGFNAVHLSFTGHALEALHAADPALMAKVQARAPALTLHGRIVGRGPLTGADRWLMRTDPSTLALQPDRPGPLLLMQQLLGVTPIEHGGDVADAFRARWATGSDTAGLLALGLQPVPRGQLLMHPNQVVADGVGYQDPDDNTLISTIQRTRRAAATGRRPPDTDRAMGILLRLAQLAQIQGQHPHSLPLLAEFIPEDRLIDFVMAFPDVRPTDADEARLRDALRADPSGAARRLDDVFDGLCSMLRDVPDAPSSVRLRLSELPTDRVHACRMSWHASDDYSSFPWARAGRRASQQRGAIAPVPERVRPESQQRAIRAAHCAVLDALSQHPRVQPITLHSDTQRASAPSQVWMGLTGLDLATLPAGLDVAAVERSLGIRAGG